MKIGLLIALSFLIVIQCDSQNKKTGKKQILNEINIQSDLLNGFWMSDTYLKKIEKSKAVYINRESQPEMLGFELKKENLVSDRPFLFGFTSHEGGVDIPICFNGKKGNFVYNEKNPSGSISLIELNSIEKDKLEISFTGNERVVYRRIEDAESEFRRILFEGEFESIDNNRRFAFNRNGDLTGFEGKKIFEVVYDFGLNIEFDAIVLYNEKEGGNWSKGEIYKYEFDSGTLKLYHVDTDWQTMNHKIGTQKLELRRVN